MPWSITRLRFSFRTLYPVPLVTAIVFNAGCNRAVTDLRHPSIDTLPNGTIHVRNGEVGIWNARSAWTFSDPVILGSVEGMGADVFGLVTDFDVDTSGQIYVLDLFSQDIRVFNQRGHHVRTIGRPGSGPGEFKNAHGLSFDPSGRLWVSDPRNLRYSVFDTEGNFLNTFRRDIAANQAAWSGAFDRKGQLYDLVLTKTNSPSNIVPFLVRYDTTTHAHVDTVPFPPIPPETPFGWSFRVALPPHWWLGIADRYRLYKIAWNGDTTRIVDRKYDRPRLTAADDAPPTGEHGGRLSDSAIPTTVGRIFQQIVVDDQGNVWVMLTSDETTDATTTFNVFDSTGTYLGPISTFHRVEPNPTPVIRSGRIVFLTRDHDDVPFVVSMTIDAPQ